VVRLEGAAIGVTEGIRKLCGRFGNVIAESLSCEVETTDKPE